MSSPRTQRSRPTHLNCYMNGAGEHLRWRDEQSSEAFLGIARSAGGADARAFAGRDSVDDDSVGVERSRKLEQNCRLRRGQAGVAENVLAASLGHSFPR